MDKFAMMTLNDTGDSSSSSTVGDNINLLTVDEINPTMTLNESNETNEKELPPGESYWDKLPNELIDMVHEYTDLLTKVLHGRIKPEKLDEKTIRAVWQEAFKSGWLGNYSLLPSVIDEVGMYLLRNDDPVLVKSRALYEHLCKYFPDATESNPEFAEFDKQLNRGVNHSKDFKMSFHVNHVIIKTRLLNIAMHNMWMDVIGKWICKYPYSAAFHCILFGHARLLRLLLDTNLVKIDNLVSYKCEFYRYSLMDDAAAFGHLDVLKLLHERGCTGITYRALDYAAAEGYLDIVEWLHENGNSCTKEAMDEAAGKGHLAIIKFLHENKNEGCTTNAIYQAAEKGHVNVVKWLLENRTEGFMQDALDSATKNGHSKIVKLLNAHRHLKLD